MKITLYIFILFSFVLSCNKEELHQNNSESISFSVDTLKFDTLINGLQSYVQSIKVFNRSNDDIQFHSVFLSNGSNSPFDININGKQGKEFNNINLPSKDSLYVFVNITPNIDIENDVYLILDSLLFNWNGLSKSLPLQAFAQPVELLKDYSIDANFKLEVNKKYLVQGTLELPSHLKLNIPEGVVFYQYPNSKIIIKGEIDINGTPDNPVIFTTYRIDQPVEGSWEGIEIIPSGKNHSIEYAIIKYAKNGLSFKSNIPINDHLQLVGSKILHSTGIGINLMNVLVSLQNSLITNNNINIKITGGGNYTLRNITTASFSSMTSLHVNPSLYITDQIGEETNAPYPLNISILNSIIWGDLRDEIYFKSLNTSSSLTLEHCIYKSIQTESSFDLLSSYDIDPLFEEIDISRKIYNFKLSGASPAIDEGKFVIQDRDITGALRVDGKPDLGCYEFIQ